MKAKFLFVLASLSLVAAGVAQAAKEKGQAHADLASKSGSNASGVVDFADTIQGVKIDYYIKGLQPNSVHGIHIHEKGDCSSADAKSAGGHYKELAETGGTSQSTPEKYAGDLQQIKADGQGVAQGTMMATHISVNGKNSIVNHAVVLHDGPDDVTKASPPRIACGVISKTAKR